MQRSQGDIDPSGFPSNPLIDEDGSLESADIEESESSNLDVVSIGFQLCNTELEAKTFRICRQSRINSFQGHKFSKFLKKLVELFHFLVSYIMPFHLGGFFEIHKICKFIFITFFLDKSRAIANNDDGNRSNERRKFIVFHFNHIVLNEPVKQPAAAKFKRKFVQFYVVDISATTKTVQTEISHLQKFRFKQKCTGSND